eukprot:scaffold10190_cov294-Chaetoceros_neogracile.AAC.18
MRSRSRRQKYRSIYSVASAHRCPVTGQDDVSPDDLLPNVGLRKAADLFVKGKREKQAAELDATRESNDFEDDRLDKGLVIRKGMAQLNNGRMQLDDFGDPFRGDVFDLEEEVEELQEENQERDESEVAATGPAE